MTDPAGPRANPTPPTSTAVARRAGVSRATVSYVLNGQAAGRVGERTQARVRAAAEELGYVPHAAARSLRAGRGRIVLLAAHADTVPVFGPLFTRFLAGFQTALHGLGYTVVLHGAPAAFAEPRLAGVRAAAAAHPGARVRPLDLALTEESAARLAADWPRWDLDAVFAYNDEYAMLLMRALQDAGRTIGAGSPDDIAVVGADDLLLARLLRPRLTSVRAEITAPDRIAELVDALIRAPGTAPATHRLGTFHVQARDSG